LERVKLIFALGSGVMPFIEDCWPGKTSRYKRKVIGGEFDINGNRSVPLVVETKDERQDIVLIGLPSRVKADDISASVEYALGTKSGSQALLVGTARDMRPFLPKDPRVGSRYQPIIGVTGISWGMLIRNKEESILKISPDGAGTATSFMNELISLVWNFERETQDGGKLCSAKRQYEGTWRDPWDRFYSAVST